MSEEAPNCTTRRLDWFLDHPVISVIIVIGVFIIAFGNVAEGLKKIRGLFGSDGSSSAQSQRHFRPDEVSSYIEESSVKIEQLRPDAQSHKIQPEDRFLVSAVVSYIIPKGLQHVDVSLEVNTDPESGRPWSSITSSRVNSSGVVTLTGNMPSFSSEELAERQIQVRSIVAVLNSTTGVLRVLKSSEPVRYESSTSK